MEQKLTVGMRLQTLFTDSLFYNIEILSVSVSQWRARAPVKIRYSGYGIQFDTWLSLAQLKATALKVHPSTELWVNPSKVSLLFLTGEEVFIDVPHFGATVSDLYKQLQMERPLGRDAMYRLLKRNTVLQPDMQLAGETLFSAVISPKLNVSFESSFPYRSARPVYKAEVMFEPDTGTNFGEDFHQDDIEEITGSDLYIKIFSMLCPTDFVQTCPGVITEFEEQLETVRNLLTHAESAEYFVDDFVGNRRLVANIAGHTVRSTCGFDISIV